MYAVIDVETTGLHAGGHDRICEIAVVQADAGGRITDDWCSLVNPARDLGPQHLHGITAAEARRAPTFAQLAGEIIDLLRGRVVVAHNLPFDARFLLAEYARLQEHVPVGPEYGLCTMRLAASFLPAASRSLQDCCLTAGISLQRWHSALHDARAAAALLRRYLAAAGEPPPWHDLLTAATKHAWPALRPSDRTPVYRRREGAVAEHFLARLLDRLPRVPEPPQADAYLALLDQVLLDRHVSQTEADALVDLAHGLGLARTEVVVLHQHYLQALATEAADDGVITPDELGDLRSVAALLGLAPGDVTGALEQARRSRPVAASSSHRRPQSGLPAAIPRFSLRPGDLVVFTGQTDEPREVWEDRAHVAGLVVGRAVTKKTRLLVAADPDSMSGKALRAQKYHIPIVHPAGFLQMIGRA